MASNQPKFTPLGEIGNMPVLDKDALALIKAVDDGGLGLTKDMFYIFRADTPPRLSAIGEAIEANDIAKIREVSHAMKGSCGIIGALRLKAISELLEAHCKGFDIETSPSELLERMKEAFVEASAAMEDYIADASE